MPGPETQVKSRRPRVVPLDALVVRAVDTYALERLDHPGAAGGDFLVVNLFRKPIGSPLRPDAVNELLRAASKRAGLAAAVAPHQLRHAFGSNLADAGGRLDEIADLLGQRLRRAVEAVPTPRAGEGWGRVHVDLQ